jgi:hypothetical protein
MNKTTNIITNFLIAGFISIIMFSIYRQMMVSQPGAAGGFTWGFFFMYMAALSCISAGWLALIFEGKAYPLYSKILYILIVLWMLWVYFRDNGLDPSDFFATKSASPFLALSIMFTTSNPDRLKKLQKVLFYGVCVLTIGLLVNMASMGTGFTRFQAWGFLLEYAISALWMLPFLLFSNNFSKQKYLIVLFCFAVVFISMIIMAVRSNIIICSLILLSLLFFGGFFKKKDNLYMVIMLSVPLIILAILFLETEYRETIEYGFQLLEGRGREDTRTTQLEQFIEQLDANDLITGAGTKSLWYYRHINNYYAWLDNQWMLTAWWAGLFPAACFFLMCVIPIWKSLFSMNKEIFVNGLILFFWILACAGLSIYVAITIATPFFISAIALGIATYNYSNANKVSFDAETNTE